MVRETRTFLLRVRDLEHVVQGYKESCANAPLCGLGFRSEKELKPGETTTVIASFMRVQDWWVAPQAISRHPRSRDFKIGSVMTVTASSWSGSKFKPEEATICLTVTNRGDEAKKFFATLWYEPSRVMREP